MPYQVTRFIEQVTERVGQFDRNTWIVIAVVLVTTGVACMRGFGSRTNY
jgi:TRAP-type mannitol/chloroaromatic compound transport system permease small subunit